MNRPPRAEKPVLVSLFSREPPGLDTGSLLLPALRGLAFLEATGGSAENLDRWWHENVPPGTTAVCLAMDEPGIEHWIAGSDAEWYVGVQDRTRADALAAAGNVVTIDTDDPGTVLVRALRVLAETDPPAVGVGAVHEPAARTYTAVVPRPPRLPISLEVQPAEPPVTPAPEWPAPESRSAWGELKRSVQGGSRRLRSAWLPGEAPRMPSRSALGPTINAHRPIVVGFGSRKGGVGKTTHAAAVAATAGEAFDGLPDTAALVDANVTNPDSWALNPPPDATTVRVLVSRLCEGSTPPREQYARTPRLAIYPESRSSDEVYTQAEVDIVVEYLRRRHSFVAVDLPNALPSLTSGGPAAVAAAWLVHCDVVVLPFDADPRARQGLLEYLDALARDRALAGIPVVSPYITSANRAIATNPAVLSDVARIQRHDVQVVPIPDDENALLALLRDQPINRASAGLRRAYLELTQVIVDAALRRGHGR